MCQTFSNRNKSPSLLYEPLFESDMLLHYSMPNQATVSSLQFCSLQQFIICFSILTVLGKVAIEKFKELHPLFTQQWQSTRKKIIMTNPMKCDELIEECSKCFNESTGCQHFGLCFKILQLDLCFQMCIYSGFFKINLNNYWFHHCYFIQCAIYLYGYVKSVRR